ncbi:hypothetical protein H6P81_018282 [Aristolochia fimbriata]|uniref:Uncharacterized protein n=1 Tax=Aristolochia fimbriata TaxID=158543 RepID=A0AAV7E4X1_ARIFI|nr:hypothetical protein H6P81_018282 [Aristolochia fimbriata]
MEDRHWEFLGLHGEENHGCELRYITSWYLLSDYSVQTRLEFSRYTLLFLLFFRGGSSSFMSWKEYCCGTSATSTSTVLNTDIQFYVPLLKPDHGFAQASAALNQKTQLSVLPTSSISSPFTTPLSLIAMSDFRIQIRLVEFRGPNEKPITRHPNLTKYRSSSSDFRTETERNGSTDAGGGLSLVVTPTMAVDGAGDAWRRSEKTTKAGDNRNSERDKYSEPPTSRSSRRLRVQAAPTKRRYRKKLKNSLLFRGK